MSKIEELKNEIMKLTNLELFELKEAVEKEIGLSEKCYRDRRTKRK